MMFYGRDHPNAVNSGSRPEGAIRTTFKSCSEVSRKLTLIYRLVEETSDCRTLWQGRHEFDAEYDLPN